MTHAGTYSHIYMQPVQGIYARACVCMHVSMHKCRYMCMYVCMHVWRHGRMYVIWYIFMHICRYVCTVFSWIETALEQKPHFKAGQTKKITKILMPQNEERNSSNKILNKCFNLPDNGIKNIAVVSIEENTIVTNVYTVNDRLSAAALIKVFRFVGAALIRLRRLFDCGAYFKDC